MDAGEVLRQLGNQVDLVLDGGAVACASPSTVVDITVHPPVIVRQGPVGYEEIRRLLEL